jgi:hypothetical protein
MNVGVMKDYKLRDLRASHTLFIHVTDKMKKKRKRKGGSWKQRPKETPEQRNGVRSIMRQISGITLRRSKLISNWFTKWRVALQQLFRLTDWTTMPTVSPSSTPFLCCLHRAVSTLAMLNQLHQIAPENSWMDHGPPAPPPACLAAQGP